MLAESKLWWHDLSNPHWLTKIPANMEEPEAKLPELKTATVTLTASEMSSILTRFLIYRKRVNAYGMRWKRNVRETRGLTLIKHPKENKSLLRPRRCSWAWVNVGNCNKGHLDLTGY